MGRFDRSPRRSTKYVVGMLVAILIQGISFGLFLYPWIEYPALIGWGLGFVGISLVLIVNLVWRD